MYVKSWSCSIRFDSCLVFRVHWVIFIWWKMKRSNFKILLPFLLTCFLLFLLVVRSWVTNLFIHFGRSFHWRSSLFYCVYFKEKFLFHFVCMVCGLCNKLLAFGLFKRVWDSYLRYAPKTLDWDVTKRYSRLMRVRTMVNTQICPWNPSELKQPLGKEVKRLQSRTANPVDPDWSLWTTENLHRLKFYSSLVLWEVLNCTWRHRNADLFQRRYLVLQLMHRQSNLRPRRTQKLRTGWPDNGGSNS